MAAPASATSCGSFSHTVRPSDYHAKKKRKTRRTFEKSFRSHLDFSLFVLMKKIRPHQNRRLPQTRRCVSCSDRFGSLQAAAPSRCEARLAIQLFHLRCPAASRRAHIQQRAWQLPIFLGCCQREKKAGTVPRATCARFTKGFQHEEASSGASQERQGRVFLCSALLFRL